MYYTVYKITNSINGKIYVGVHKTSNLDDDYMGSGKLIRQAINKYGIENFTKEYIKVFDNAEDMFNMESELVNEEFINRDDTYNLKQGGDGGFDYINKSLDYDERCKISQKGNPKRSETIKKLIQDGVYDEYICNFNKRVSQLHKEGIFNYDNFKGKKHTDESKKKISEANSKHQSGKGNSQYGTMWIHSLTEKVSKKIKKDEFSTYEQQGWLKGRKMKFN